MLIFFICSIPVGMKPLTPLAVINTIATPHPSRHFPVGSAALLTPYRSGAQGKHGKQPISQDHLKSRCPPWEGGLERSGRLSLSEEGGQTAARLIAPPVAMAARLVAPPRFGGLSRASTHTRQMRCWHAPSRSSFGVSSVMGGQIKTFYRTHV